jgi:FtsP/CotA-like multicopper oxidase with cupredoxin domain
VIPVEAGKTYRLRVVAATLLVYTTVCFEGHSVSVVAADGIPTEPRATSCVDVNSGQRCVEPRVVGVRSTRAVQRRRCAVSVKNRFSC